MKYIDILLKEAKKAYKKGNVPVAAIIIKDNKLIAKAHNTKNTSNIAINHAELICIKKACKKLKTWYLNECEMIVTLKPCDMCIAAIAESRIKKVSYILDSNYDLNINKNKENIKFKKIDSKEKEFLLLLSNFFKNIRNSD